MQILSSTDRGIIRRARRQSKTDWRVRLGRNVRQIRKAIGLSIRDLETKSGTSRGILSHIENGTANPTLHTINQIAHALGVSKERLSGHCRPDIPIAAGLAFLCDGEMFYFNPPADYAKKIPFVLIECKSESQARRIIAKVTKH